MTANFWDKQAERYDNAVQKHEADFQRTIAGARSLLSAADVVLDLGCASGEYGLAVAPFVRSVHGIDLSSNMIALAAKKASRRAIANLTFAPVDIFDRSLDAHHFTAVLAFNVLHLVGDIRSVLRRIGDLLPAGGLLISETPCLGEKGFLFRSVIGLARRLNLVPAILRLAIPELEAAIAGAGCDIIKSEAWGRGIAVRWIVARKRRLRSEWGDRGRE